MPSAILFCVVVILGMLAARIGAWLGQKRALKGLKEGVYSITSSVTAMLGLLAFMLGFTFSLTANRFSERRTLVVRQANAIGTSYLRTSLIPEKQKLIIRNLLHQYTKILLNVRTAPDIKKEIVRLAEIKSSIWQQTSSLVQEQQMDSEIRSLFISSINNVIELENERITVALIFRLPPHLWISLLMIFFLSMLCLGYQEDDDKLQRQFNALILSASFAMVMTLIADMDSLGPHSFRVSQQPLEELQIMMQQDP